MTDEEKAATLLAPTWQIQGDSWESSTCFTSAYSTWPPSPLLLRRVQSIPCERSWAAILLLLKALSFQHVSCLCLLPFHPNLPVANSCHSHPCRQARSTLPPLPAPKCPVSPLSTSISIWCGREIIPSTRRSGQQLKWWDRVPTECLVKHIWSTPNKLTHCW